MIAYLVVFILGSLIGVMITLLVVFFAMSDEKGGGKEKDESI